MTNKEKMNKKEFEEIIEEGESDRVEFKTSLSELKDALGTLVGFSWLEGGVIVFGVSRSGKVVGVDIGKGTIEDLANNIKQNTDPKLYPLIKVFKIDGKNMILVEIEKTSNEPGFAFGRAYKRVGKSTHKMSRDEYKRIILEKHKDELRWDGEVCKDASLEDVDEKKVRWFLKKAKVERGLKIDENIQVKEVLMKLRLVKNGKLTNAAVLLFSKEPKFLQSEIKCIRFKGNKPVKPYIDFQTLEGNVFDLVDKAEDFVLRNIKKAIWVVPGRIEREEKYEYPSEAIREAIVNAVVHRDYYSPSKVQIRVFDDYVEIWNPGKLPEGWTVEKLKQKHESVPKNPLLFKQFFWVKFVEDVGGGTIDMINECRKWSIPDPEFEDTGTSLVVSFTKSKFTEEYLNSLKLNNRQKEAISYISEKGKITRSEYEKVFEVHERQANRELKQLLELRLIEKHGRGYKVYYVLSRQKMSRGVEKGKNKENEKW